MAPYLFQATCLLYLPLSLCLSLEVRRPFLQDSVSLPQSRQSAKLFSSRRNLDSPNPSPACECAPPPLWFRVEGHTRWRERGWESPNSDEGTYTVVLCIYVYFFISPFS
jgi:hypothetical protein